MARLNEDEVISENDGVFRDINRRNTITAKIDNLPVNELGLKKDVLQLADHVCQLYDHWKMHSEEFGVDYDLRNKRRQTLLSLNHTISNKRDEFQATNEIEILDLREHTDWFINNNADLNIRFTSEEVFKEAVNNQPRVWFLFLKYISNSLHYADLHIGSQDNEVDNLRSSNEELSSGSYPNPLTNDKRTKYSNEILRLRKEIDIISKERDTLRAKNNLHEIDSDDEFLNHDCTHNQPHDHSTKPPMITHSRPTTYENVMTHQINSPTVKYGSNKPSDKIDVFDGKVREKYDEWVDKFLGQIKTYSDWFIDEDRKLTYLMRHLTGPPYNLLKDKYDERARLNPLHGRTLMNALAELDRAFQARNIRLDAKTKLETLRIGNNQSFGDFFAKFQIQINKLNYNDEDKIDELKSRLNFRFASRIISGRKESYDELVDHCYTLDSELSMYEAKKADHATVELGKSSKLLAEMTLKELKDYRNSLPRSAVIKQRLQDEKRCHRCMQKGYTGLDQVCQFNRLPQTEKFKQKAFVNSISASDEGNGST